MGSKVRYDTGNSSSDFNEITHCAADSVSGNKFAYISDEPVAIIIQDGSSISDIIELYDSGT
jgi:hypothetical protein